MFAEGQRQLNDGVLGVEDPEECNRPRQRDRVAISRPSHPDLLPNSNHPDCRWFYRLSACTRVTWILAQLSRYISFWVELSLPLLLSLACGIVCDKRLKLSNQFWYWFKISAFLDAIFNACIYIASIIVSSSQQVLLSCADH